MTKAITHSCVLAVLSLTALNVASAATINTESAKPDLPPEAWEQTGNLLAHGSFENGLEGWQSPSFSTPDGQGGWTSHDFDDFEIVMGETVHGEKHLKFSPPKKLSLTLSPKASVKVFKGCTYSFKVSFKRNLSSLDVTRTTPSLRVIYRDVNGVMTPNGAGDKGYYYHATRNKESIVDAWTSAVYTFTVDPASDVEAVYLTIYIFDAGTIELDNVGFFNDTVRDQFVPKEYTTEFVVVDDDEARLGLPEATIPRVEAAPAIDGRLNDEAWKAAKENLLVNAITGGKPKQSTEFQMAHDERNLYVFIRAVEKGQESHQHGPAVRDAQEIYANDAVEVYLQPAGTDGAYYQIVANPKGGLLDLKWLRPGEEMSWQAKGIQVGGDVHTDDWNVELTIPFADLGVAAPKPGDTWRANVCRTEVPGSRNWNAWSSTGGEFHRPERFGLLRFVGIGKVVQDSLTLRGKLVDENGKALGGIPVKAFGRIERTDPQGHYVFENVTAGAQYISIISPKHTEIHGKVLIKNSVENVPPVTVFRRDPFRPAFSGPIGDGPIAWVNASITEPPLMTDAPKSVDLLEKISLRAAKGETKAKAVSIFTNRNFSAPDVALVQLKGANGSIPAAQVDVRWVQRMLKPVHYQGPVEDADFVWRFLWQEPPAELKKDQLRLLVLTVDIPREIESGNYTGELVLTSSGQTVTTLPVELTVGAFALDQPEERAGAFLNVKRGSLGEAGPQWNDIVLKDMVAHGATTVYAWAGINFSRDGIPHTGPAEESLRMQIQYGMKPPYAIKFSIEQLAQVLGVKFKDRHAIDIESLKAKETEFRTAVQRGVEAVRALEKRFDLQRDDLVLFWSDEVFIGERLEPWLATARIVREYTDNPLSLTFDPRQEEKWQKVEPFVEVPFYHGRNLDTWIDNDTRTYEALKERLEKKGDVALAYYNITRTDITPEYSRIINGLWLWRTPLNAQMHWTYFWGSQDAMVGVREGERLAPYFALAAPHPTKQEMVSTLDWENLREGVTDHKYITTLENAIKHAAPGKADTVEKAQALLAEMWSVDPRVSESAGTISAAEYDRRRALMYDYIEDLRN